MAAREGRAVRRLSKEQWMATALAVAVLLVVGYYVHLQRDIGDRNQARKSLLKASQALAVQGPDLVETNLVEYDDLALEVDLFLAARSSHRYPEFTGHLLMARMALDAAYELQLMTPRAAPLLSEVPDVARAVEYLPQLRSLVAGSSNPRITDIPAARALLLKAARDELEAADSVHP